MDFNETNCNIMRIDNTYPEHISQKCATQPVHSIIHQVKSEVLTAGSKKTN